jgi:hypothetical protein
MGFATGMRKRRGLFQATSRKAAAAGWKAPEIGLVNPAKQDR